MEITNIFKITSNFAERKQDENEAIRATHLFRSDTCQGFLRTAHASHIKRLPNDGGEMLLLDC